MIEIILLVVSVALIASIGFVFQLKKNFEKKDIEAETIENERNAFQLKVMELEKENAILQTKLSELEKRNEDTKGAFAQAQEKMESTFKSLAADALGKSSQDFLKLAGERLDKKTVEAVHAYDKKVKEFEKMVEPIKEVLNKVELDIKNVEKDRLEQFGRISSQITEMTHTSEKLHREAQALTQALKRPEVRGSWGELQLRRVVELAGMSAYCDFEEQVSVRKEGQLQKPDMLVHLPNDRVIVVDSKAVLDAFLEAVEASNEEAKAAALTRHAKNLRGRVAELSKKSYWEQFEKAPDFAVLFIPNEALLAAAVEVDRDLIEDALKERIVIATPTTLVALLKAVAYGWQQEKVAENAQKVIEAAKTLYDRILPWIQNVSKVGSALDSAVNAYNKSIGSLETRVLPSARKINELGLLDRKELPELSPIDQKVREPKPVFEQDAIK